MLDATEEPALQMATVDGTCPQLRSLRLTSFMLKDHLTTSYFVGLGRDNPLTDWLERQSQSQGEAEGDDSEVENSRQGHDQTGSEGEGDVEEGGHTWQGG